MAVPICEHIKGDGVRCGSPVMHRRSFCYMHWRLRDHQLPVTDPAYEIPIIDSEASVVLVSAQIMRAVFTGKLDARQARVAVSCLNIAAQAMRTQLNVSSRTVIELTPAMSDHFSASEKAQAEYDKKCLKDQVATKSNVILKEDARPSEGSHQSSQQQERSKISHQPAASQSDVDDNKIFPSPVANMPLDAPLTDKQLDYCRFVLRYGPTHPEFIDCSRRLEPEIKTRATA